MVEWGMSPPCSPEVWGGNQLLGGSWGCQHQVSCVSSQGWWPLSPLGRQMCMSARFCFLGRWQTDAHSLTRLWQYLVIPHLCRGGGWADQAPPSQSTSKCMGLRAVALGTVCVPAGDREMEGHTLPLTRGAGREGKAGVNPGVVWSWASHRVSISSSCEIGKVITLSED